MFFAGVSALVWSVGLVFLVGAFDWWQLGVHAVGGTLGAVLTGIFASADVNGNLNTNLKEVLASGGLVAEQLKAVAVTLALSLGATLAIGLLIKHTLGLRPSEEDESRGLDVTDHGEEGYSLKG